MPTPVTGAKQCLAQEAAAALDDAVVIATRRRHLQTTSLHMVAALFSLPTSRLREACDNASSARVQSKALELSLAVSLDRLPSSTAAKLEQPPVANSLMAAIKRSQANQRRHPESFGYYQQQQCCSAESSVVVRVEIQNLVFSILDDPLVSRVFWEAGFRSYEVKLATLRQSRIHNSSHLLGYSSRFNNTRKFPPLFLSNVETGTFSKCLRFPFLCGDGNSKKIGEVMVRANKRNPLLLGASADIALTAFLQALQRKVAGVLPVELNRVSVVCVEDELLRFVNGDRKSLELRLEEVGRLFRDGAGQRVVLNMGELGALAKDDVGDDCLRSLVRRLGRLVRDHCGNLWLIGYDVCSRVLNKFPSIKEEWDLEILPITFSWGGSCPKSSLMKSFVPFGGFFYTEGSFSNAHQHVIQCQDNQYCQISPDQGFHVAQNREESTGNSSRNHSSISNDQASRNSVTSVTTDLCLGAIPSSVRKEIKKPVGESPEDSIQGLSSSLSTNADAIHDKSALLKEPPEMLCRYLFERFGHQEAVISVVVEAIRTKRKGFDKNGRADVWMNFRGPDKLTKRNFGLALAEVLYGSAERLIYVDLNFQDEYTVLNPRFMNKYDVRMRGTVVDYLVEKLSENPGIVFLENIDMSDPVVQTSLSRAVQTGKLTDLHGREVNVNRSIFLLATQFLEGSECHCELAKYMEEYVIKAQGRLMQITVGFDLNDDPRRSVYKRKVIDYGKNPDLTKRSHTASSSHLDLNHPAQEICNKDSDTESSYKNSTPWLEDLDSRIDCVVVFKAVDFDLLAEKLYKDMMECLHDNIGFECALEIESQVMQQLLAAAYVFGSKKVEDWIQSVLGQGFVRAMGKFGLDAHSVVKLVTQDDSRGDREVEGTLLLPGRIEI